jgi:hypothetical protein
MISSYHQDLLDQLEYQRKHNFDLEGDIDWQKGIDKSKELLPFNASELTIPLHSQEEYLVISQFLGLLFNAITAEMEEVAFLNRDTCWRELLKHKHKNPELITLGEQFFAEERKHSILFQRYNTMFAEAMDIPLHELDSLFPRLFGSLFKNVMKLNAQVGGLSFWWTVAATEDVAVKVFTQMRKNMKNIDPLFFEVHKKHFEEESKHASYAFLMLEFLHDQQSIFMRFMRKFDRVIADVFGSMWLLSELLRMDQAKNYQHPFFQTLAAVFARVDFKQMALSPSILFHQAPYISLYLNRNHHQISNKTAHKLKVWSIPFPKVRT